MAKIFGSILIIAACALFSTKMILLKRKTISALHELVDTLDEITHMIKSTQEPLPTILSKLHREHFTKADTFVGKLATQLQTSQNCPIAPIWQESSTQFSQENALPSKAESILAALGDTLGKADCETEIERLQNSRRPLEELLYETEQNHKKTEKLIQSFGLILGIFIVIILL